MRLQAEYRSMGGVTVWFSLSCCSWSSLAMALRNLSNPANGNNDFLPVDEAFALVYREY